MADLRWTIRVDLSDFRAQLAKAPHAIERIVELTALEAWRNVAIGSPVDHGRLRASWQLQRVGRLAWEIVNGVDYLKYVVSGHGVIRPKNAKALRFQPKGSSGFVFARFVRAVPPNDFVDQAAAATEQRVAVFARIAFGELGIE